MGHRISGRHSRGLTALATPLTRSIRLGHPLRYVHDARGNGKGGEGKRSEREREREAVAAAAVAAAATPTIPSPTRCSNTWRPRMLHPNILPQRFHPTSLPQHLSTPFCPSPQRLHPALCLSAFTRHFCPSATHAVRALLAVRRPRASCVCPRGDELCIALPCSVLPCPALPCPALPCLALHRHHVAGVVGCVGA